MALIKVTGIAKKRVEIGAQIVNEFFYEKTLDETFTTLNALECILQTIMDNGESNARGIVEIIQYARSYAANVKPWAPTSHEQQ